MRVLLLSAYAAQSHVHWQESLADMFPGWEWQVLSLPPRHFSWRVRGNPLFWALAERDVLERGYDLLIATSMVDLATLRGLVPALTAIPSVLYFHENQFVYPQDKQQHSLLEAQMVSLYSALAADRIVFNSHYNRSSFMAGCEALLRRLPDKIPPGIIASLQGRSSVVAVPVVAPVINSAADDSVSGARWSTAGCQYPDRPLRLLWVGRFEHDRGGQGLLRALEHLEHQDLDYQLAMVGQQFRNSPDVFDVINNRFSNRLVQFGYLESVADYRRCLGEADIVLSTSEHEFQGLAILEAVAAGCLPAVPDRLVYPEIFPAGYCYCSQPNDPENEARELVQLIYTLAQELKAGTAKIPDIADFYPPALAPLYQTLFRSLVDPSCDAPQ